MEKHSKEINIKKSQKSFKICDFRSLVVRRWSLVNPALSETTEW